MFNKARLLLLIIAITLCFRVQSQDTLSNPRIDSLKELLSKGRGEKKADLLLKISESYRDVSADKALEYAKKSLEFITYENLHIKKPWALLAIGNAYYGLSEYEKASNFFNKALEGFAVTLDKKGASRALNGIGIIYYYRGNFSEALKYFNKAIFLLENSNFIEGLAGTYINISMVYFGLGQNDKALNYLEKNLELLEKIKYPNAEFALSMNNLAIIYYEQGDDSTALEILTKLVKTQKNSYDKNGYIFSLSNLGAIYNELGQYQNALKYLFLGLKTAQSTGDNIAISNIYNNLGTAYYKLNNYDTAIYFCSQSLYITQKVDLKNHTLNNLKLLSDIYEAKEDYKLALKYNKLYKIISDSIMSENNLKQALDFQIKYDTDKKAKKLVLLKQENEIKQLAIDKQNVRMLLLVSGLIFLLITLMFLFRFYQTKRKVSKLLEEKNLSLSRSINTKDKLFSVISHDLKNPVETFYSLAGLLNEKYDQIPEANRRELITQIEKSSKNLFYSLDNILLWSVSEQGLIELHPMAISLNEAINEALLTVNASASRKKIIIKNTLNRDISIYADKKTIITVFRNILSNAVKFTNENGTIEIIAIEEKDFAQIIFSDNGIGINQEALNKLLKRDEYITTTGTNNEKGTGLGLIICKEFIKLNNGHFEINSTENVGTEVRLKLPYTEMQEL